MNDLDFVKQWVSQFAMSLDGNPAFADWQRGAGYVCDQVVALVDQIKEANRQRDRHICDADCQRALERADLEVHS